MKLLQSWLVVVMTLPGMANEDPPEGARIISPQGGPVAFSPEGDLLLAGTATAGGDVRVWDASSGKLVQTLAREVGLIGAVDWSPDGCLVAAAGTKAELRVWESESWKQKYLLQGHSAVVQSLAFCPDGRFLASGSSDGTIRLWNLETGNNDRTLMQPLPEAGAAESLGRPGMVFAVAVSPDGRLLASGGGDGVGQAGELAVWDLPSGRLLRRLPCPSGFQVWDLAFSPDSRLLFCGSAVGTLQLWEVETGKLNREFPRQDQLRALAYSKDGKTLASASRGTIHLWDARSAKLRRTLIAGGPWIGSLAFSPDGGLLASGGSQGVMLWELIED